ncbi:hypothetical protein ACS0TY_024609 [Phlomoides rotata]
MSSWIPSLFNPFSDDDNPTGEEPPSPNNTAERSPSSGAKDDLSAVFRGVAAFLAPPQPSSSLETIEGIKNDLAEIQGSFRSGLSLISSKLTSNLMQLQNQFNDGDEYEEVDEEEALGLSEEVLDFVLKISRRPELWTDFPLSLPDDFDMSDSQREHAANIDHLVPEFETLRQKICSQMSERKFWLIYFILLLPRLDEEDMKFLSTPQVAEARETLLKKLQNKNNEDQETSENSDSSDSNNSNEENSKGPSQHKDESAETVNVTKQMEIVDETDSGHQSKEVDTHPSNDTKNQSKNEEDVSFSDLEDDDDNDLPDKQSAPKLSTSNKAWVELGESSGTKEKADQHGLKDKDSEGEDSNDWLTVDDTDFDNLAVI